MSEDEWFWMDGNSVRGPNTIDHLIELFHRKEVSLTTSAWRLGADEWKPLGELIPAIRTSPPPLPIMTLDVVPDVATDIPQNANDRQDWSDRAPHPWRRLGARIFDNTFNGAITIFAAAFVIGVIDPRLSQKIFSSIGEIKALDAMLTVMAAIPLNALLIGTTGGTLGKWIFGIRILDGKRSPIGFLAALYREGAVWAKGLGLAIPLVSLFFIWNSYRQLTSSGQTSWDIDRGLIAVHRAEGALQTAAAICGVIAILGMAAGLRAL